jgi:hypothetical protein
MVNTRLLLLLAAIAAAGSGCPADQAPPAAPGGEEATELRIVVDGGEFDQLAYTVTCGPGGPAIEPGQPELDPATACDRLADPETATYLVEGHPPDQVCTQIYGGPQQATVTGTLQGQPVDRTVSRRDGCEIDAWDRLLAGVLPPTIGVDAEGG